MELLTALRQHLLDSPLGLQADELITYAREGKIINHQGDTNLSFGIEYQAHVVLINYGQSPDVLFFIVLDWLRQYQANHTADAIRFDADILDHQTADLELIINIEEGVGAEVVAGGVQLTHNGVKAIDPQLLNAEQWSLLIQPDPDAVTTWLEKG
ncbi:MAG: phage tail protein [Candidatus Reddybacter sp.]